MEAKFTIEWERDKTADGYFVMKEVENNLEELVRIENINFSSVVVPSVKENIENHFVIYYYQRKDGKYKIFRKEDYYSYRIQNKQEVYRFPIPELKRATKQNGVNLIEWEKVADDMTYVVFRRLEGGRWHRISITKETTCVDKNVDEKKYIYTVRCISEDGKNYLSRFSKKGIVAN